MPNQNMQGLAAILAEQGRNGDTMLMHVAPSEVEYLAGLGGITQNPMTGLPEAFKFKDLLPFVGSAFLGPAFKAVGFSPGVSNFLATTASTMLGGGSLEKGIMSGLVSSSIGRLGRNLADLGPDAAVDAATGLPIKDTGYKFGLYKKPETGTFGSRYSEAFQSPEFNPVQMVKAAGEAGLDNLIEQIQKPSVMLPFTIGAGELGRIKAEEDYARQYQNFLEDQAERRRKIRERTPQILPPSSPYYRPPGMAQGGKVERKFDGYSFDFSNFEMDFPQLQEFMASSLGQQYAEPSPASIGVIGQEPVYMPEFVQEVAQVDNREAELAAAREAEMVAAREAELIRQREQAAAEAEAARVAAMQRKAEMQRAAAEAAAAERERQIREAELARLAEEAAQREAAARTRAAEEAARREAERIAAEQARIEAERQAEIQRQQQLEAQRQAELARAAQLAEEARQAELARQQEVARQQEAARLAAEQEAARQAEFARQQEAMRVEAERQRQMEEARQAEVMRQAELQRQAEAARQAELAEIQRRADLQRQAEMEAARQQEAARIAAEEEVARAAQPTGILTALPEPEISDRQPVSVAEPAPVPATTPIPEEPVYTPPASAPAPIVTEQDIINSLFVSGADVPQSAGINEDALYNLGALLSQPNTGGAADVSRNFAVGPISVDPNVAGTALSGEAFGVTPPQPTSPPPPATEQDLGLSQAEIDAIVSNFKPLYSDVDTKKMEQDFLASLPPEEKKAVEQMNDYSQFLQNRFNQIREALAAKDFEKAFDLAISGDKQYIKEYNPGEMTQGIFTANLMRTSDISQMTGPMTEEDIRAYYEAMPVNEVIPLLYPGAKVGDYVYTLDKNKAMQQDIANLRASGGTGFPSAANQVGMKSTKQNLTIPLIAAALAFAGVPFALGDAIASSSIGAKLGLAGLGKAGTTALGSAIIGASGSALQGGSFEDALKAGLIAAGFSFIAETALGEIKEAYNNWAFDNLPAGEQVANTLVTVADPSNVIVTAVNQANNIAQSVTQTAAQVAAQQVSQPEVKVETTRDATQPSVPTTPVAPPAPPVQTPLDQVTVTTQQTTTDPNAPVVAPPPAPPPPVIQTPLDQVTVTTQQQQPQQPNVPVVVTPPAPPAPPPPPPVIETPLDQVTVTTQQPTTQQPNVPVVVPPPAPPVRVEPPLDQVTVTTSPTTQDRVNVPVIAPPPAPPPVIQTPLDQVTVTTSPTTQDKVNVPVVVPPPAPPPVVQTPLDQVTVTTSPVTDDRINVPTPVQPPPTPVELTAPVEEIVVTTKPVPKDELNIPTPTIPITTPVTPPVEPVINTPDLLDTLKEKGKDILTDAAIAQLLGALAGGGAGGGAGAGAGGGGYAGTGGLGYIPEGFGRRYIGAPEDYRHGFLPEWMFFENLNPPAIDLTTPGSTPGTTPGTPGTRPGDPDIRIEPKAAGGKIKSYSPRGYLDLIQGYSEGGEIEDEESIEEEVAEYSQAPMTDGSRGLIQLAQAAILGQLPEEKTDDVIQKFIDLHGNKAFRELREKTLESVANGSRKEGMIEGHTGGMDDMVEGVIGSSERVAVSPGEFIIPADVVSMLGDGNSDSGRTKLEQMMSRVRKEKTGSTKQAKPINSAKVLPA